MIISIKRKFLNQLYTEGRLLVNDYQQTFTVEATEVMLPPGQYQVRLTKDKARRRVIGILKPSGTMKPTETFTPTGWSIGIGHSWIGSRKHHVIAIGQPLIPGSVYKATEIYERLFDRIEKCEQRGEPITLVIDESQCVENKPIKHWTTAY